MNCGISTAKILKDGPYTKRFAVLEEDDMSRVKEQMIQMIEALPDDVTADDVLSEIFFKMQVDEGLRELDEGTSQSRSACQNG